MSNSPEELVAVEELAGQAAELRLGEDLQRLNSLVAALQELHRETNEFQQMLGHEERGHFDSQEFDATEDLLFRFVICRQSLMEMIDFYRDYNRRFPDPEQQARAFVVGYGAAVNLYRYSSGLVHKFLGEPDLKKKLNEAYHRSEIPAGTYDQLFRRVTDPDILADLSDAGNLFAEEVERQDSPLGRLQQDPTYMELLKDIVSKHQVAEELREAILEESSSFSPELRNRLRHSSIVKRARAAAQISGDSLYAMRGLVFANFGRLKAPRTPPLTFHDGQIAEIKSVLQPGDVLFTFSEGYMSNLFLPGAFKHGIAYVGSPAERLEAGLDGEECKTDAQRETFLCNLQTAELPGGYEADIIEAVAEGVVFSSLAKLSETKISRMVALRPRIATEERQRLLTSVFNFLGCGYDFKFDFNDASFQCCTEMLYRSLNGLGDIRFSLTQRAGRLTLSADDIVNYALEPDNQAFSLIMLVVEDEDHCAEIHTGDNAHHALMQLMNGG